jgi:hypothetical protein
MSTQQHTSTLAVVDRGSAGLKDAVRRLPLQQPASAPAASDDWRLQFDAVIWRMRSQADDALVTPDQQRQTLLDCARALEQLRAMDSYQLGGRSRLPCLLQPQLGLPVVDSGSDDGAPAVPWRSN